MFSVDNFSLNSGLTKLCQNQTIKSKLIEVDTVCLKCHNLYSKGKFSNKPYLKETSDDNCHVVLFT
jgi:hypothetical protein